MFAAVEVLFVSQYQSVAAIWLLAQATKAKASAKGSSRLKSLTRKDIECEVIFSLTRGPKFELHSLPYLWLSTTIDT